MRRAALWPRLALLAVAIAVAATVALAGRGDEGHRSDARTAAAEQRLPRGLCDERPTAPARGAGMPACWRPYSAASPFNRRLPERPRLLPASGAVVRRTLSFGPLEHLRAGQAGASDDFGHPTYYSRSSDPVFTLHCLRPWGTCEIEGRRIRIPDAAKVPDGSDGHMTVVDVASGWEYDMWQVRSKPRGGGTLTTSWGGRTRIDGDGLGSDAVAARFGSLAGKIRAEELAAGEIDHALFMGVRCDSGRHVYPAAKSGRACSDIGESDVDAPAMGTHFMLDMSEAEIRALEIPEWKRAIVRAAKRYGMFVGDTGGTWGLKEEGGLTYTSFGGSDRWVDLASRSNVGFNRDHGRWIFDLRSDVDWAGRLRVVDPCVAARSCR